MLSQSIHDIISAYNIVYEKIHSFVYVMYEIVFVYKGTWA